MDLDGNIRLVMVGCRESDFSEVEDRNSNWQQEHTKYTHGVGCVVLDANANKGTGSKPEYLMSEIPARSVTSANLPDIADYSIYYGTTKTSFAVVHAGQDEHHTSNTFSSYAGDGGVRLSSPNFRRQVAWYLEGGPIGRGKWTPLNRNTHITDESQVMFHRDISSRVAEIAPFFGQSSYPYPVLRTDENTGEGYVTYVLDLFVGSTMYPYGEDVLGLSYYRHVGIAAMDAYHGDVELYLTSEPDPLTEAWLKLFPNLVNSFDEIPNDLLAHLRFPDEKTRWIVTGYGEYHVTDTQRFFNGSQKWVIAEERLGTQSSTDALAPLVTTDPYYLTVQLPNEEDTTFQSMLSLSPIGKPTIQTAVIAVSSEANEFGKVRIYLTGDTDSPMQFEDEIKSQFQAYIGSLLVGGEIIRGATFIIPVDDELLYLEPLFGMGEKTPTFHAWFVGNQSNIACGPTVDDALKRLYRILPKDSHCGKSQSNQVQNDRQDLTPSIRESAVVTVTAGTTNYELAAQIESLIITAENEPDLSEKARLYRQAKTLLTQLTVSLSATVPLTETEVLTD